MRLNLNAKEFLALYNNLYEHVNGASNVDPQLRELFNRVRACIIAGLSGKESPSLEELYLTGQHEKIERLKNQNAAINKDLSKTVSILTEDADDPVISPEYPRKVSIAKGTRRKG